MPGARAQQIGGYRSKLEDLSPLEAEAKRTERADSLGDDAWEVELPPRRPSQNALTSKFGLDLEGISLNAHAPAEVQTWQWAAMTCFQLVYSAINTGFGLFVLPTEALRLNSENASVWVGVYLAVCGITQLACPIAGKISDRHQSRYGRRRPVLVAGTVVALASFVCLWTCSAFMWATGFAVSLFPLQLALNVCYAAQCGLPADLQTEDNGEDKPDGEGSKGVVSGLIALHSFVGSLVALGCIVLTTGMSVTVQYPMYMVILTICCLVVCFSTSETPTLGPPQPPLTSKELRASFWIDWQEDRDFFWVCVGRLAYYMSTSTVVFIYYYIRDMTHVASENTRRERLGIVVLSAQLIGAAFTVPFSRLSNHYGRKPVIYAASGTMSCTFFLYVIAPKVGDGGSWPLVVFAGLCYGIGSGAYLSVDYALALDCMPSGKTAAEAFGLWGVAGFIGTSVGPIVGGVLLGWNKTHSQTAHGEEEYSYLGYALVMLVLGVLMNLFVIAFTQRIRKAK